MVKLISDKYNERILKKTAKILNFGILIKK